MSVTDMNRTMEIPSLKTIAPWMEGEFGGEWMHVYVQLSPSALS